MIQKVSYDRDEKSWTDGLKFWFYVAFGLLVFWVATPLLVAVVGGKRK